MGAKYVYRCDKCSYSVCTSGPWEFYRDTQGNRKPYGHPEPTSEEARLRGIYGLSGDLYCSDCGKVFDLIVVEFKKPSHDSLSVWSCRCEPKDEFKQQGMVKCPECGNTHLILEPDNEKPIACPRCKEGRLTGAMEWIS
ncbi:hypothetical protein E3J38_09685 [candidate division TA06 bacterium]|uniref:Uncharacterized protein n=1 Tax=candidate division TA06 bacterium TaxID=2250710 RepID=A0A523XEE8_UNCT6|nr:MAG: hypothetical protein E3J38_09685 [candidate division TA06 bacterium]